MRWYNLPLPTGQIRSRVECPWCGESVAVRNDGMMRKHKYPRATSWTRGPGIECNGSGRSATAPSKDSEIERDPAPYCQYCGAMRRKDCDCGPIADNH